MVEINIDVFGKIQLMFIQKDYYNSNHNTALRLYHTTEEGNVEVWTTLTVNTKDKLPANTVAIKDYGECKGHLDMLIKEGIVSKPLYYINSGYVDIPVCLITNFELLKQEDLIHVQYLH